MIENGILVSKEIDGIKYGITNYEVAKTIGVASVDIGRLCTSTQVKRDSKYKPIRSSSMRALVRAGDDAEHPNKDEFRDHMEGSIAKPYGIFLDTDKFPGLGERHASLRGAKDATELNLVTWDYSQPEIDDNAILGYINEKPIKGIKDGNVCRLSDFNGYYHGAKPAFEVKWERQEREEKTEWGETEEDWVTVVVPACYKCTVTINDKVDTDVTFQDLKLTEWNLTLFVVSKRYTDGKGHRYVYGRNSYSHCMYQIGSESFQKTVVFTVEDAVIYKVLDDLTCFIMAVPNQPPKYDITDESIDYDYYRTYVYYPQITNLSDLSIGSKGIWPVFIENSAFDIKNDGGMHDVLFSTNYLRYKTRKWYSGIDRDGVEKDFSILLIDDENVSTYDRSLKSPYDISINLTEEALQGHKSNLRKLVLKGDPYVNDVYGDWQYTYLNNVSQCSGAKAGDKFYVPLLCNASVIEGGSRWAEFYIRYTAKKSLTGTWNRSDITKEIVARLVNIDGTSLVEQVVWNIAEGTYDGESEMFIDTICFANIVNADNSIDRTSGMSIWVYLYNGLTGTSGLRRVKKINTIFSGYYSDSKPYIDRYDGIRMSGGNRGYLQLSYEVKAMDEESVLQENAGYSA